VVVERLTAAEIQLRSPPLVTAAAQKSDDNLSEFNVGDRVKVLSMARVRWEITRYSMFTTFHLRDANLGRMFRA
jgi:hypothetical protein